jgi:F-type H+-transporting ATPase subunit gamma
MASASLQDIKARIKSVSSTMQMTKAMELVASSKLRRAKAMAESSRGFTKTLFSAISKVSLASEVGESVWSEKREGLPRLFIVIAGDRGLAGGYNSNILKMAESLWREGDFFLPVGKRAKDYFERRERNIFATIPEVSDADVGDAMCMGEAVAEAFYQGRFSEVVLVYTRFISMLSCQPTKHLLLPLSAEEMKTSEKVNSPLEKSTSIGSDEAKNGADEEAKKPKRQDSADPIYEGDPEEILMRIVPAYLGGMLNSAILEASASEQSSRRNAMSSANKNAQEIIDTLSISYNRARQAAITQEITEIISGADAL